MRTTTKLALAAVITGSVLTTALAFPRSTDLEVAWPASLSRAVDLTPTQEQNWIELSKERISTRGDALERLRAVRELLDDELAQSEPDLARVAGELEAGIDQIIAELRSLRDASLRFYDDLDNEQKRQFAEAMQQRLERLDRARFLISRLLLPPSH